MHFKYAVNIFKVNNQKYGILNITEDLIYKNV